jgi:hypothetical protein
VRDASEYFDDIQEVKITKDMLDLARHIVEQKSGHFQPDKFEDHYEAALAELLAKKQKGQPIAASRKAAPSNVVNLMDAVRASLKETGENEDPGEESHQKAQVGTVRGTKLWAGDCMGVELLKGRQKRQSKQRSPVRRSDREQPRPLAPRRAQDEISAAKAY